jgi:hypothetical protein
MGQERYGRNKVTSRNNVVEHTNTRKEDKLLEYLQRIPSEQLRSNFYISNRVEDVIQEGQDEDGLIFQNETG